jgi:hypothetical protein
MIILAESSEFFVRVLSSLSELNEALPRQVFPFYYSLASSTFSRI